jgi:DNA-binding Lrp family transcriptional regulator
LDEVKLLKTVEEIRALSDPYRYKILNCFYKNGEPITVKQAADELGEVPAKVHYHVKKMEKAGLLILVFTKEINGIIAKYYEPTAHKFIFASEETEGLDNSLRLGETLKVVAQLYDESKKTFLEQASLYHNDVETKKLNMTSVSLENIFLTDKEAEDVIKYIENLMARSTKKQKAEEPDINEYHCFFSIIKTKNK